MSSWEIPADADGSSSALVFDNDNDDDDEAGDAIATVGKIAPALPLIVFAGLTFLADIPNANPTNKSIAPILTQYTSDILRRPSLRYCRNDDC